MTDQNNEENFDTNERGEENRTPENKYAKESSSSSIDAEVINDIQAQIASLTQRDELKKIGLTRPHPLEWDSAPYPPKFKPSMLHTYDGKSSPNQYIYYFWYQTCNVIDNDAIMARLFIGTLRVVAFD